MHIFIIILCGTLSKVEIPCVNVWKYILWLDKDQIVLKVEDLEREKKRDKDWE